MTPNPGPVNEPELKDEDRVDTKPVLNIEFETKPSDTDSDVMAQIKFKCAVDECSFKTNELEQTVVATVLCIHSEANHVDTETSYRSWIIQF
jgi:hypothetical protein